MQEPMVPIDVVATHFGVKPSTVRLWVKNGKVPRGTYARIGKNTLRFKLSELERFFTEEIDDSSHDSECSDNVEGSHEEPQERAPVQLNLDFNDDHENEEDYFL